MIDLSIEDKLHPADSYSAGLRVRDMFTMLKKGQRTQGNNAQKSEAPHEELKKKSQTEGFYVVCMMENLNQETPAVFYPIIPIH